MLRLTLDQDSGVYEVKQCWIIPASENKTFHWKAMRLIIDPLAWAVSLARHRTPAGLDAGLDRYSRFFSKHLQICDGAAC